MKKIQTALFLLVLVFSFQSSFAKMTGEIQIDLTDQRKVFETDFGTNLVLRVRKDSSVQNRDFGWILEVNYKSSKRDAKNLIYSNPTGTTADRSQVYAWQVGNREFPNYRVLTVKGRPQIIKVTLIDPKIEGEGENARFTSGKLKISWSH